MAYEVFSRDYDLLYSSKDYESECSFIIDNCCNSGDILDVGCGTGTHASILSKKGRNVTGIDISEAMIKVAKEKHLENQKLSFYHESLLEHSQNNMAAYDTIICMFNVINHIDNLHELSDFFKNCGKLLKKNGKIIFDCWNSVACCIEKPYEKSTKRIDDIEIFYTTEVNLFESSCKTVIEYGERRKNIIINTTLWSPKIIKDLLNQNNMKIEKVNNFRNLKQQASEVDHRIIFVAKKEI
jgi:SAM-dependent methyltransferase